MQKVTYASLGSLGEDFHKSFDSALSYELKKLGRAHPLVIRGQKKKSKATFTDTNPADTRMVLGEFAAGTRADAGLAITAARDAFPDWRELGWPQRVAFLRKAAEIMTERQFRLAALLSLEVGKNRFEAIAEVSESIDLILYYCQQMESNRGYVLPMGVNGNSAEQTRSVLKPHGVWAVVSPTDPSGLHQAVGGVGLAGDAIAGLGAPDEHRSMLHQKRGRWIIRYKILWHYISLLE